MSQLSRSRADIVQFHGFSLVILYHMNIFKIPYLQYTKCFVAFYHNRQFKIHPGNLVMFVNEGQLLCKGISLMCNCWEIPSEDKVSGKNESERNTKVSVIFQGFHFTCPHSKWRLSIKSDWVDWLLIHQRTALCVMTKNKSIK